MDFASIKPIILINFKAFSWFSLTFLVSNLCAQTGSISGKLTKAGDTSVAQAYVFLDNTTVSSITDEKGTYTMNNILQGRYALSAFVSGFEPYQQNITLLSGYTKANINLKTKEGDSSVAASKADEIKKKNLEIFLKTFGKKRKDIKLINPGALHIRVHGKILEASSSDILKLENIYLGYEIKLLIKKYIKELSDDEYQLESGPDEYDGIISYTELKGSSSDQKRWQTNRLKTYQGSALHFYRSLIANDLKKQGFSIYPLVSKLNSKRASDSLINSKILSFENQASGGKRNDSLKYWNEQKDLPKFNHVLYRDTVKTSELITTDSAGLYVLKYPYKLYVKYTNPDDQATAMSNTVMMDFHRPVNEFSVVIELKDHLLRIDANGSVLEPGRVKYEGGWSPKIAEMLPLNYNPEDWR